LIFIFAILIADGESQALFENEIARKPAALVEGRFFFVGTFFASRFDETRIPATHGSGDWCARVAIRVCPVG
jgi:hypothetical protein